VLLVTWYTVVGKERKGKERKEKETIVEKFKKSDIGILLKTTFVSGPRI